MNIKELKEMTFDEAIEIFLEDDCFTTIDTLKAFIVKLVEEDDFWSAEQILRNIINERGVEYFHFDYSCASYSRPTPIVDLKDLEKYCDDYFEYYKKIADQTCGLIDGNRSVHAKGI